MDCYKFTKLSDLHDHQFLVDKIYIFHKYEEGIEIKDLYLEYAGKEIINSANNLHGVSLFVGEKELKPFDKNALDIGKKMYYRNKGVGHFQNGSQESSIYKKVKREVKKYLRNEN